MCGVAEHQMALLAAMGERTHAARCWDVENLANQVGLDRRVTAKAAGLLIARGYIARHEVGCYVLTEEGAAFVASGETLKSGPQGKLTGHRRPCQRTFRDRVWEALRIRQKASVPELVELAGTSSSYARDTDNCQRFLRALAGAGYLRPLPHRDAGIALTSNGFKRWHLLRDTGPEAPRVSVRNRTIFDPNTQETFVIGGLR